MRISSRTMRAGLTIASLGIGCATIGVAQAGAQTSSATAGKLAYIRSQDIFAQAPGRTDAESQFNAFVQTARAEEKTMGDSINAMLSDYGKAEATLAADAKASRQQAIRDKQAQFQQRQQQLEQQVQQKQSELVGPILERINKIINDLRAENGYAMVFDAQASGGSVVAADKNLDITDQVIARLRTMAPGAPVSSTKPAPAKPAVGPTAGPSGVGRPKSPSQ
jgi:outer membrane protein